MSCNITDTSWACSVNGVEVNEDAHVKDSCTECWCENDAPVSKVLKFFAWL